MKLTFIAFALTASISQADIIKCNFTEPSVSSEYNTTYSTLTYKSADGEKVVMKDISFQIKSAGLFELVSKTGQIVQTLELNHEGSDGMSDKIYPYGVKDNHEITHQGYGGCVSIFLK